MSAINKNHSSSCSLCSLFVDVSFFIKLGEKWLSRCYMMKFVMRAAITKRKCKSVIIVLLNMEMNETANQWVTLRLHSLGFWHRKPLKLANFIKDVIRASFNVSLLVRCSFLSTYICCVLLRATWMCSYAGWKAIKQHKATIARCCQLFLQQLISVPIWRFYWFFFGLSVLFWDRMKSWGQIEGV